MRLTEFLLARIAEDEAAAKAAIDATRPGAHWQWVRSEDDVAVECPNEDDLDVSLRTVEAFPTTSGVGDLPKFVIWSVDDAHMGALPHIARHDPARVLAECAAKRVAVDWYLNDDDTVMSATVKAMAAVYADHPDYRQEWKP